MGKKSSKKKSTNALNGTQASMSLREESIGKKQTNINAKTMLKLEHIKNLSLWASGEAHIPSLAALFGHRLAASTEALSIPPDPSLFTCQRCESVLQPGNNCTVRIEKNRVKSRHRSKKPNNNSSQNSVVYSCHFCLHRNLIRGTPLGHMRKLSPKKTKRSSKPGPIVKVTDTVPKVDPAVPKFDAVTKAPETPLVTMGSKLLSGKGEGVNETTKVEFAAVAASVVVPKADEVVPKYDPVQTMVVESGPTLLDEKKNEVEAKAEDASVILRKADLIVPRTDLVSKSPATPVITTLLDERKRKRNRSGSKKVVESVVEEKGVNATSSKRKRKSWTSLKEIVESSIEQNSNGKLKNMTIPFLL